MSFDSQPNSMNPLLHSLVIDFELFVEEKANDYANSEVNLKTLFEGTESSSFYEIIGGLANISSRHFQATINWLITWRDTTNSNDEKSFINEQQVQKKDSGVISTGSDIKNAAYFLCIQGIIQECQKSFEKQTVKNIFKSIINIVKEKYLTSHTDIRKENAKYFAEMAATIVNQLVDKNLAEVEEIFFLEFYNAANSHIQSSLILLLQKIKIQTFSIEHVENIFNILTECSTNMQKTKEKELKINIILVISEILMNFADVAKSELNIPCVKNFIESLTSFTAETLKKYKYSHYSMRLATSLLCCSVKKNFFSNYFSLLTNLMAFLKPKDAKLTRVSLECIEKIVWVYVVRYQCEDKEKTRLINFIVQNLINTSKTFLLTEFTQNLTKIINIIYIADEHHCMAIITDLLPLPTSKHFCPDKIVLGLKIYINMLDSNQKKETTNILPANESAHNANRFHTLKKVVFNKDAWELELNRPERKIILDAYFQILSYLDNLYGRTYLKTNSSPQKYITDQTNSEKKSKLLLYKQCVAVLYKFIIPEDQIEPVSRMLARLSIHMDEDIANCAYAALKVLFVDYSKYSSNVMKYILRTYLNEASLPGTDVNMETITYVRSLVQMWRTCLSNENSNISNPESLYLIEAFCILNILNSTDAERQIIHQILKETKTIHSLFPQNENLQPNLYEEILKYLVDINHYRSDSYFNLDLVKLLEQSHSTQPWHRILGHLLRDSQISYICPLTIMYVQEHGGPRFKTAFTVVESVINLAEAPSRLTLSRAKKTVSYTDIQYLQNLFTIYCCPAIFQPPVSATLSLLNLFEASSSLAFGYINDVFDKLASLFRTDDSEIREAGLDVLCLTHSTAIPILLKSLTPLFKEISETKPDYSSRKKRRRDIMAAQLLKIFANISKNQHLSTFINVSKKQTIMPLIDFCDCVKTLISQDDIVMDLPTILTDLAITIANICYGLHCTYQNDALTISNRESYYKLFINYLNDGVSCLKLSVHQRAYVYEALFSLLYIENILTENAFSEHLPEIRKHISMLNKDKNLQTKVLVLNTIDILLNHNEFDPIFIDWILHQIYSQSSELSNKLAFCLLDYFEKNTLTQKKYISILALVCILLLFADPVIYLRVVKFLIYSQRSFNEDSVTFSSAQNEQIENCIDKVFEHILTKYSKYITGLISEFFKIYQDSDFTIRTHILICFEKIFKTIRLEMHVDYFYANKFDFQFPESKTLLSMNFETSIFSINNLIYITKVSHVDHSDNLKNCWTSLCCYSNQNFQLVMHYMISLSHNEDENLHELLKIIFGYIYTRSSEYFREFIFKHLKIEQNPKLKISSCENYPYISVCSFSYVNRVCVDKKLINTAHSKSYQSLKNDDIYKFSWFYCCPFQKIVTESPLMSYHCALLSVSSYIISFGPIPIEESFVILLHLSINELFNSSHFISTISKYILVSLCMNMLNSSGLLSENNLLSLNNFNSLLISNNSYQESFFSIFVKHSLSSIESNQFLELMKAIESTKYFNSVSNEAYIGDTTNNSLYKFMDLLKSFMHECGFYDNIQNFWRETCVHFSTKCSSINISCYSLFVFRVIENAINYINLKKLIICYINRMTEAFPDVKKFKQSILQTLYTTSMHYLEKSTSKEVPDRQNILTIMVWFFTNHLLLSGSADMQMCFNFLNDFFLIPTGEINDIFFVISHTIKSERSFVYILINTMFTNPQVQNQCLLLLINLAPCLIHSFVISDEVLGLKLIGIILAFFFIDFFDKSPTELPEYFETVLKTMKNEGKLFNLYKIFNMFKPLTKRKDISLFLQIIFPELLDGADKRIIQILIKFLTDIIGLADGRGIKNSLHLLNSLIDHVGAHNIAQKSVELLLAQLSIFIKNKTFGKISYEVSSRMFENLSPTPTGCPHEYMNNKLAKISNFKCSICEPGIIDLPTFEYYMATNFFFETEPSSFENKMLKFLENAGVFDEQDFYQLEMYVADIPRDYNMPTQQQPADKIVSPEEFSVDSSVLVDDILESLAFLDSELDKDFHETVKLKSRRSSAVSTVSHTSKSEQNVNYSIVPMFEPVYQSQLDMSESSAVYYIQAQNANEVINSSNMETEINSSQISTAANCSSIEATMIEHTGESEEYENEINNATVILTPSKPYSLLELTFISDEDIYEIWVESYLKCIHSTYKISNVYSREQFHLMIHLLPLLMEGSLLRFYSIIKILYHSKSNLDVPANAAWLNNFFLNFHSYIENFFIMQEFPFYIVSNRQKYVQNLTNERFYCLIIKMSNSMEKIFRIHNLMQSYINNQFELTEDHIIMMIHSGRTVLSPTLFQNLKTLMSNKASISENVEENLNHNFLQISMFEIIKSAEELIQNYVVFIDTMKNTMKSFSCTDITEDFVLKTENSFTKNSENNGIFKYATLHKNVINNIKKSHFFSDLFDLKKWSGSIDDSGDNNRSSGIPHSFKCDNKLNVINIYRNSLSYNQMNDCGKEDYIEEEIEQFKVSYKHYSQLKQFRNSYLHDLISFNRIEPQYDTEENINYVLRGSYSKLSNFSKSVSDMLMSFLTTVLDTE